MVKNRKILLIFINFFLHINICCASFSVDLELADVHYIKDKAGQIQPTVFIGDAFTQGETFKLKIITTGKERSPNNVTVTGLENFTSVGKSDHSSVSINNSSVSLEKITTHMLVPKKEGTFTIGPAKLVHNGKTITSNNVTVHVAKKTQFKNLNTSKNTQNSNQKTNNKDYELFCTLLTNKNVATIEEPIIITLQIYTRGNITGIKGIRPPNFPNCTVKDIKKIKEYKKQAHSKSYSVIEKQFIVYPNKPGELLLTPAQVIYNVRKKIKKRRMNFLGEEFFSNFFDSGLEQKVATSNPITIKINELPDQSKKIDGIGTFSSFIAKVDKSNVRVNEPIKLSLELTGDANFDLIPKPKLELPPTYRSYDSTTELIQSKNDDQFTKIFQFILQVAKEGNWTIPSQKLAYFDTATKEYKTITTKPIKIKAIHDQLTSPQTPSHVVPPQNTTEKTSSSKISKLDSSQPTKDIHFIQDTSSAYQAERKLPTWLFLLIILLTPLLMLSLIHI